MEINTTAATIYNLSGSAVPKETGNDVERISIWHLPKIAWATGLLFSMNLLIATGVAISPELDVDIYGEAVGDVVLAGAKPSPFVEPEPRPRAVRAALKLTPIVEFAPEIGWNGELAAPRSSESATAAPAAIPAAYRQPAYVTGSYAYEAAEKQMKFQKVSTAPVEMDATSRKASEIRRVIN
jgi:hypothetical protein